MINLRNLMALTDLIGIEAAVANRVPYVPSNCDEVDRWQRLPFPLLGLYEPPDWESTDVSWVVDTSGWGYDHEPAPQLAEFKAALKTFIQANPGAGFGLTESGLFQVRVTVYRPRPE